MTTAEFLEALCARVEAVRTDAGVLVFEDVAVWDSDDPDEQIETLQETKGRFALITHDATDWITEQRGRIQTAQRTVEAAILISNRKWNADAPAAGPGILEVLEILPGELRGRWLEEVTVKVANAERFRPNAKAGKIAGRIIYRLPVIAEWRSREPIALTR